MEIKGEYEVNILLQNMFSSYEFTTQESNIVTNEGLNFILEILINKTSNRFGNVYVGTNNSEPSPLDNTSSFNKKQVSDSSYECKSNVDENTLTFTVNTDGAYLDETCEIGIFSDDEQILVTRDVHDTYNIPSSAIITLKYSLTLSNREEPLIEEETIAEEENSND